MSEPISRMTGIIAAKLILQNPGRNSEVCHLIHTGLQPGVGRQSWSPNRFNGINILDESTQ